MEITTLPKYINSIGLLLDIAGAWFVAWEVVSQYQGDKFHKSPTWSEIFDSPKETDPFKKYEKSKLLKMKIGLGCLTLGFALQIISNFLNS